MRTYTEYHPRWLRPRMSTYWWLQRASYLKFILRELSSIFVAWWAVVVLRLVAAVSREEPAYQEFLGWMAHPVILLLNAVSFLFVVFHAITWFNLAPQAMVVRLGSTRVPGSLIALSNYLAWVAVSALVVWILAG